MIVTLAVAGGWLLAGPLIAAPAAPPPGSSAEAALNADFQAEKRLIEVYQLIGAGRYETRCAKPSNWS